MQAIIFEEAVDQIVGEDPRYPRDAYLFLRDALAFTQKTLGREANSREAKGQEQHVSGQELLAGIRDYALDKFGPMAITVLEEWGIRSCQDFGEMVFTLVSHGLLGKTERDSRADFEDGYVFEDAFRKPFLPQHKQKPSLPPTKVVRS